VVFLQQVEQFVDIKCYEVKVKFSLCLINLYETDLKANCISFDSLSVSGLARTQILTPSKHTAYSMLGHSPVCFGDQHMVS